MKLIAILVSMCLLAGAILTGCDNASPQNDQLKAERSALTAEGNSIVADMERANRNKDWSRVREIREHKADWERRNQAWQERARKEGWR